MKLDKKKIVLLCICLFLVFAFAYTSHIQLVGADSGFDSSYDSSSGGSSGGIDISFLIYLCLEHPIFALIVVVIIVLVVVSSSKKSKKILEDALNSKLELLNVNDYDEEKRLEIEAFNIYKEIQFAWMNFDEEKIRKLTTDEMYNMYLMQLDTLKVKNQKNIMHDIKYISSKVKSVYHENGQETILINMTVSCYDFIIDTKTNQVLRGVASKLNIYNYDLTFVKSINEKQEIKICPQCGAPVEANNSGKCEYCKSTLVSGEYTLILSKKKMISQK